jgi:hypothetical protein
MMKVIIMQKRKKEAFELINVKDNVDYQISSYVEKQTQTKVA